MELQGGASLLQSTVRRTLHAAESTLHIVDCPPYAVPCTLHTAYSTLVFRSVLNCWSVATGHSSWVSRRSSSALSLPALLSLLLCMTSLATSVGCRLFTTARQNTLRHNRLLSDTNLTNLTLFCLTRIAFNIFL